MSRLRLCSHRFFRSSSLSQLPKPHMPRKKASASAPYPGISDLDIAKVTQKKLSTGEIELTILVRWDHEGPPERGLPAWVQVRIQNASGRPVYRDSREQFVVPKLFDLTAQNATLTRVFLPTAKGKYELVVDPAHPEMLASEPWLFEVK